MPNTKRVGNERRKGFNLGAKFLTGFLMVSLVPVTVLGYIEFRMARETLYQQGLTHLAAIADHKIRGMESYVLSKERDVATLAHTPIVLDAMQRFEQVFHTFGGDSPEYTSLDREFGPFLNSYQEDGGYYDLFLISVQGDIVFTVKRESDFGTNILAGPYQDSELEHVFSKAMAALAASVSNFSIYVPSDEAAAFVAAPLVIEGRMIGVVALQMDTEELYGLAGNYIGLGQSGEVVLATREGAEVVIVAPLRHDPHAAFTRRVQIGSQESLLIQRAVQGMKGRGLSVDYRGKEILAVWRYLPHLRWGIVVKMDTEEAFASVADLAQQSILLIVITLLCVTGMSFFAVRLITKPIKEKDQAEEALHQKHASLRILQMVAVTSNEATDVESALRTILNEVCAYTGWPIGHVYMMAEDSSDQLRPTKLWHLENPERFKTFRKVTEVTDFGRGIGLPGRVLSTGKPAWIIDVTKDSNFPRAKFAKDIGVKAGFAFPLLVRDKVEAVLEFFSAEAVEPDESLLEIMAYVGTQLGRVIERNRAEEELREAYQELKEAQNELVQSEKLAALGRFSSGLAHEVKNPLAIILNWASFLKLKVSKEDGDMQEAAAEIEKAVQRADGIVQGLLRFSRPAQLKLERIRAESVVDEAMGLLKHQLEVRNVKVETRFSKEEDLWIDVDKNQIQQVLFNLLMNAADAMPQGGEITVKAYPKASAGASPNTPHCVIEVSDTGEGISQENLSKVLEPFFTTKREQKGTGLGLSICKTIVDNHGGELAIQSELGKGTDVKIILPLTRGGERP